MSEVYTLPPDLTAEERAVVEALRAERLREADEDAAIIIRVKRVYAQLQPRYGRDGALGEMPKHLPVTASTAERIVYGKGRWGVPG